MPLQIADSPMKADVALVLRCMRYADLREFARELSAAAAQRADPAEELGGFKVDNPVDWAELLVDWAEAN